MNKKIISEFFILALVIFILSGCSISPLNFGFGEKSSANKIVNNFVSSKVTPAFDYNSATTSPVNNPANLAPPTASSSNAASSTQAILKQADEVDEVISDLKGENLITISERFEKDKDAARKESEVFSKVVSDNQDFLTRECSSTEASYAEKIKVNNFNNDEVRYFWPDDENSFRKNLIVSLAVKENLNCLTSQIKKIYELSSSTPSTPSFFYEGLANAMTADILLDLVVVNNISKHPEYCQNIEDTYKMGKLCRAVKVEDAAKRMKQYYEITGFWDYFKKNQERFSTSSIGKDWSTLENNYVTSKIKDIQDNIETDSLSSVETGGLAASSSNPFWDMTSLVKWIQTPYDIYDLQGISSSKVSQ